MLSGVKFIQGMPVIVMYATVLSATMYNSVRVSNIPEWLCIAKHIGDKESSSIIHLVCFMCAHEVYINCDLGVESYADYDKCLLICASGRKKLSASDRYHCEMK